jgi:di/tripeptidase
MTGSTPNRLTSLDSVAAIAAPMSPPTQSSGGADANAFEASGLHCVCLANGTERNHEPTERVSFDALEGMLAVSYALRATPAAVDAPA